MGESTMRSEDFDAAMERCITEINKLPDSQRERLLELVHATRERQQMLDRSLREALDALDDWRICQKYFLFDMEARQRELALGGGEDEVDPSEWL
jgi:hypothetical protein